MDSVPRETLTKLFTIMVRGRAFEEGAINSLNKGLVPGFIHVGIGQEAVAAGICCDLRPGDSIVTNHRGHVHAIAKGVETKRMMAELFGRKDGFGKGKAGSMHLADKEMGLLCATGIVGAGLSVAAGIALAQKLRGTDDITVCFFGDGAANQGTFHESLNIAAAWQLPAIYCCENNSWAQFTPQRLTTSVLDIATRAAGYGIPGVKVDGNDVIAVYGAARQAVDRARRGDGPTLLECKTHRWYGHYIGDPQKYRAAEEIEQAHREDPIAKLENKLIAGRVLTSVEVERIRKEALAEVDEAIRFAEGSPLPEISAIVEDVYYEGGR